MKIDKKRATIASCYACNLKAGATCDELASNATGEESLPQVASCCGNRELMLWKYGVGRIVVQLVQSFCKCSEELAVPR